MSKYNLEMVVGDRDTWSFRLHDDDRDNDLASATCVINMYDSASALVITNGAMTVQPGQTFTADASTDKCTVYAHGLQDGWECLVSNSGGALPTGLAASTSYFICDRTPNTFKLSLEPNGQRIDITAAGTGTHTIKCRDHVTYDPASGDVDTEGTYKAWITRTIGGKAVTFPDDKEGIQVRINAKP